MRKLLAVLMLLVVGCEGPMGPPGPPGPQGPQGLPGPAGPEGHGRYVYTAVAQPVEGVNGPAMAFVDFPIDIGRGGQASPPLMACYMTANGITWLAVSDAATPGSPYCVLTYSQGVWSARMYRMQMGWTAAWIIAY